MTLIDLGTPARHHAGEAPMLRMGRALAGRRRRELLVAVIAVLMLGVLGGSAVPMPSVFPELHRVGPATSASRYVIGTDHLLTAGTAGDSVSAYALGSGEAVWRLEVRNLRTLRATGGVVIVGTDAVATFTSQPDGTVATVTDDVTEVFAVDERTGKRLWSHPGSAADAVDGSQLVVITDDGNLSAYDPVSGAQVWRRTFGPHVVVPVVGGVPRVLVQQFPTPEAGELHLPMPALSTVDMTTGAVARVGSVDYNASAVIGLGEPLAVVGGETQPEANRTIVQGGPAADPDRAWQLTGADPSVFLRNVWACAMLLCMWQGNFTVALDPVTGDQVWRADAEWVDHRTMRVDGEDLLVTIRRGENGPTTLLLDGRTGAARRSLANWSPLVAYHGKQLMVWTPASASAPAWLGYLDESVPGGVRAMFPIGAALRCSADARWLFCEAFGGPEQAAALPLTALDGLLA